MRKETWRLFHVRSAKRNSDTVLFDFLVYDDAQKTIDFY